LPFPYKDRGKVIEYNFTLPYDGSNATVYYDGKTYTYSPPEEALEAFKSKKSPIKTPIPTGVLVVLLLIMSYLMINPSLKTK
jgi:hypothetical protein